MNYTSALKFLSRNLRGLLVPIKVYALVGKSGTGKSFRARLVAEKNSIKYMIDDGLLIGGGSILCGRSAKKERLYISAIKTALFDSPEHLEEVRKKIRSERIDRILLIGTSEKMVATIAKRLNLPPVSEIIRIEDVSTKEEIDRALKSRHSDGHHVIPVPALEVKRDYASILADSVRILLSGFGKKKSSRLFEKAVVKPDFHSKGRGKVSISEGALAQMVQHCIDEFCHEVHPRKIRVNSTLKGYRLRITLEVPYGIQMGEKFTGLQKYIEESIERYTGILIEETSIKITTLN